jgi:hypothetical protein
MKISDKPTKQSLDEKERWQPKKPRDFGKRFLLIRNPMISGSDWISNQARYDDIQLTE